MAKDLFVCALLDVYGEFLSDKQKDLVSLYYNDDLSLGEIAENEGITRQAVRDAIERAKVKLYSFESSCGYCKKFLHLKELCENESFTKEQLDDIRETVKNL